MKLKIDLPIIVAVSFLVIGLVMGYNAKLLFKPNTQDIILPLEILQNYQIKQVQSFGKDGEFLAVGYISLDPLGNDKKSFLAIYKKTPDNLEEVYKFQPITENDYPSSLSFEKMWFQSQGEIELLITSWGETGADYFGTHPLVFDLQDDKFKLIPIYKGDLQDNQGIKSLAVQPQTFQVHNVFDSRDSVQTVLCQSVDTDGGKIKLKFSSEKDF